MPEFNWDDEDFIPSTSPLYKERHEFMLAVCDLLDEGFALEEAETIAIERATC